MGTGNKRSESPEVIKTRSQRYSSIPSNQAALYDFSVNNEIKSEPEPQNDKLNVSRIYKLRQAHANLIDIDPDIQQPKKRKNESSMSIYRHHDNKYFDHIRARSTEKFNEQHEEVIEVKNKLASKNIACPVKCLINGLILADDADRSLSPDILPRGGEYLIKNPWSKLSKKKKKKGKKSKKNKKKKS